MKGVLFHQDNAPAHKSVVTMATVCLVPRSLDLAPSDYFLFPQHETKNNCPGETGLPSSVSMPFTNCIYIVGPTTFQSPDVLIQCGFI